MPANFDVSTVFLADHIAEQRDGKLVLVGVHNTTTLYPDPISGEGMFIGCVLKTKATSVLAVIWLIPPEGQRPLKWEINVASIERKNEDDDEVVLSVPIPAPLRPRIPGIYEIYVGSSPEDKVLAKRIHVEERPEELMLPPP